MVYAMLTRMLQRCLEICEYSLDRLNFIWSTQANVSKYETAQG